MKQIMLRTIRSTLADKRLTLFIGINIAVMVVVLVLIGLAIKPHETQVITRYSAYGIGNFYRSQWHTLWLFSLFEMVIVIGNTALSLKLVALSRRSLALGLLALTIGLSVITYLLARGVLNIAAIG